MKELKQVVSHPFLVYCMKLTCLIIFFFENHLNDLIFLGKEYIAIPGAIVM